MGSELSRAQQPSGFGKRRGSTKRMSRRLSMGTPVKKEGSDGPPAIRVGDGSQQSSRLSLSIDQLNTPRSRSGSSCSTTQSPTKPLKHRCSLSQKNRQLIQGCFNNPHENIGNRILKRSAERRKDFGQFYLAISLEQREQIGETIKMLLKKSVTVIDSADDELQSLAIEFGKRFVDYRLNGFKADYFAVLADSTITECVLLDAAVHPAAVTLNAFSQFTTMLFSSVRDGFYTEMRRLRRISNSFSIVSSGSVSRKKLSVEDALKGVERSPLATATRKAGSPKEVRRGSTGTVSNGSVGNGVASPARSLSPADDGRLQKMSQSKSASPCSASKSRSPTPNRKISPESVSSAGLKRKDELKVITAEFLNSGMASNGTSTRVFAKDGNTGPEEKPARMAAMAN